MTSTCLLIWRVWWVQANQIWQCISCVMASCFAGIAATENIVDSDDKWGPLNGENFLSHTGSKRLQHQDRHQRRDPWISPSPTWQTAPILRRKPSLIGARLPLSRFIIICTCETYLPWGTRPRCWSARARAARVDSTLGQSSGPKTGRADPGPSPAWIRTCHRTLAM